MQMQVLRVLHDAVTPVAAVALLVLLWQIVWTPA
jgi:hypothetical protein